MRTIVIQERMRRDAIVARLLRARQGREAVDAALASIQALNPHIDIDDVPPGSVLVVPEGSGFKVSATEEPTVGAFGDLREQLSAAFETALEKTKGSAAARAAQRTEVSAALKSASFKRLVSGDAELKKRQTEATAALKQEEDDDAAGLERLQTSTKATLKKLAELQRTLG